MPLKTLFVIGSPSKGQKYPYQFVDAAKCRPNDENTLWLVERSGYEKYGASLNYITMHAPPGGYGWISSVAPLVNWINGHDDATIKNLIVFSHGLRGLVALRYGWPDADDYGLTVPQVGSIDPRKFAPVPLIEFDSCNSGIPEESDGKSVAQALADRLNTSVGGWTGRTSYADINRGQCAVQGSGQTHSPFSSETYKEMWSRFKAGGKPEYKIFPPSTPHQ